MASEPMIVIACNAPAVNGWMACDCWDHAEWRRLRCRSASIAPRAWWLRLLWQPGGWVRSIWIEVDFWFH